jgi:tetratricopeptide (TPR) repeat protein
VSTPRYPRALLLSAILTSAAHLVGPSRAEAHARTPQPPAAQAAAASPATQQRLQGIRSALFAGTANPESAIKELKDILATEPQSAEGHLLLGIAYRSAGSPDLVGEAVAELRQALSLDPSFVPARLYLALIYMELGRYERAREELEAANAQVPRNAQFLTQLGEVERQLKNPKRAQELLQQALEIDNASAQAHYYLGLTLLDLGRSALAITELEGVVKAGEKRADVYLSLGAAYLDAGRLDDGLEILSQATKLDAARPDIRILLARAYRLKKQLARAEAQLALANPKGPASVSSPFVQQRQLEYDFYQEQGLLRLAQGQLEPAAAAFRKVLEMDPNFGPVNRDLADVYLRQGKLARASDYAARAEKLGFPLPEEKRKLLQAQLKKGAGGAKGG